MVLAVMAALGAAAVVGLSERRLRTVYAILNELMPWRNFAAMGDEEVSALWAYLRSVPPLPFGSNR